MDEAALDGLESRLSEIESNSPEAQEAAKHAAEAEAARGTDAEQARAWAVIPEMVGSFVCMMAPELGALYTEAKCLAWGERMLPVAKKRGWDAGPDSLPEIALIASTLGMAIPTFIVVKKKLAASKEKAGEARSVDNGQPAGGAS